MTRVTRKGQATIPKDIRGFLDLEEGAEVDFVIRDREVVLQKRDPDESERAKRLRRFREHLNGIRGTGVSRMTTDEIMEMTRGPIDATGDRPCG